MVPILSEEQDHDPNPVTITPSGVSFIYLLSIYSNNTHFL